MGNSKPLLLVHHRQTQVFELDITLQQPVGADNNVNAAVFQAFDDLLLFLVGSKSAQHFHPNWEWTETLAECSVVLLGQHGGGDQKAHLHAVVDCFECRPQRNLSLAVAHVPANEPVHGLWALHVGFYFVDSLGLVRGFFVGKGVLQFFLPSGVRAEFVAFGHFPCGMHP